MAYRLGYPEALCRGVSDSLSMLFNRSLVESRVPGGWKLATITPIFKKGDRTDPNNYRPVALLPIISKVMECLGSHQAISL